MGCSSCAMIPPLFVDENVGKRLSSRLIEHGFTLRTHDDIGVPRGVSDEDWLLAVSKLGCAFHGLSGSPRLQQHRKPPPPLCIAFSDTMNHTRGERHEQREQNRRIRPVPLIAVLLAGAFISILNQTLLATATPRIMQVFSRSENTGQWVTTIFMLVNGVIIPIALIDMGVAYLVLQNVTKRTFPRVDFPSIGLSILGFGGLLYGFSTAGNVGWSNIRVIAALLVGTVMLTGFILRQLKLDQPILEFRVFKNPIFTRATAVGMMIMPGAVLMGITSPIAGRIYDKIGARPLAITGLSIVTITTYLFTRLSVETTFLYLAVVFGFRMLGIALVLMPITTEGLNQLELDLIPHGTAMNNTMRQVSASIGTAILVTVMTMAALDSGPGAELSDLIYGVNTAFGVATAPALAGVILSFFVKPRAGESPSA